MRRLASMTATVVALAVGGSSAHADRNDFTLERLIGPPAMQGGFSDPNGNIPLQSSYRSLMSEMGVVMSPSLLTPADSLGWSGFNFTVDSRFTAIDNQKDYWQKGVQNVSSGYLSTISVMARKGIWAPLPSFEIGAGGTYLVDSSIFALNAYAKLALQEGFHNWALPSISLRGAVSRLLGTREVDLTVISTDVTISKSVGIGGAVKLDPYLGANLLITIAKSQVIDTTPNIDAFQQGPMGLDLNANTIFPDQDAILRWRLFLGARLVWSVVSITAEFAWTFCNDTAMNCTVASPTKITDLSDGQAQFSVSAGFMF